MIKTQSLPPFVTRIVCHKATEVPFTGEYNQFEEKGSYLCRQCGLALFRTQTQFHSGCGWPSFDNAIANNVLHQPDSDGKRTEIVCARCQAHLGHVFSGEQFTTTNIRHCVNSLSLDFVSSSSVEDSEEAILAAGCFWGVEYYLKKIPGVLKVEVGYTGGKTEYPTYEEVCGGHTGHLEAVRVLYDPKICDFKKIAQIFFEIHDPTQTDGQGPDRGEQYLSAVFYYDENQKKIAESLINLLTHQGYSVATQLRPVSPFWSAEAYHQNYYEKNKKIPYCHRYIKKF